MILKKMVGKRGQEHVEMIIAFTIFISFVIFLFVMFNPLKSKPNEALVDNLYLSMKENMNVSLSTVSIKISEEIIPIPSCFKITLDDLGCSDAKKIIAKNEKISVGASKEVTSITIEPDAAKASPPDINKFFTIYCSEELVEKPPTNPICSQLFTEGTEYDLGIIVTRDLWSINKLNEFAEEYKNNYDTLKKQFVPPANDFKFDILNETQTSIFDAGIKPAKDIPKGVNVDSRNFPIDLVDDKAVITKGSLNILVW